MSIKSSSQLDEQVADTVTSDEQAAEEIGSMFSSLESDSAHISEDISAATVGRRWHNVDNPEFEAAPPQTYVEEGHRKEVRLDEAACPRNNRNDPVRLYLREMAGVPLLKREGEVALAKRMERGHGLVL